MKAAVYYGPRDVRVETVPKPSAGPGEVVLRVLRCSVCGTDKRIFTHGQKNVVPPTITGHEIVGTVDEVGAGVDAAIALGRTSSSLPWLAAESASTASGSNTISAIPSLPSVTITPAGSPSTSRFPPRR